MTALAPPAAAAAEPTPVALAIAKITAVADAIAAKVPARPRRPAVVLSYKEWHDMVNDLNDAQFALRTEQVVARRQHR
jgi:hypothetical protein